LQQFLRFLIKKGVTIDKEILEVVCSEYEGDIHVVYLDELILLNSFDFKDSALNQIRDVFLFMSFTGQRYSDISKINSKQFSIENNYIVWMINTKKTKDRIKVPIVSIAEDVLKKYTDSNKEFPVFSEPYFNRQIKVMAKYAGLERNVMCTKRKKGIVETSYQPLCDVITSHVARKSFITNAIILGMQESEVKQISGHKDDRSFRRYVNLGNSVNSSATNKFSKENINKKIKELENMSK
jgi:site-specific recombinase XerD